MSYLNDALDRCPSKVRTTMFDKEVEVEINVRELVIHAAHRATLSRNGRSRFIGGALKAKVL